ncbi:MAG: hypothetical protein H7A36_01775 [Chlamydiales bacterium]|nr:hypothetical protein [Chlamydiales bacterium]
MAVRGSGADDLGQPPEKKLRLTSVTPRAREPIVMQGHTCFFDLHIPEIPLQEGVLYRDIDGKQVNLRNYEEWKGWMEMMLPHLQQDLGLL